MEHNEVLAIIPARGGSQGLLRKNVRLLGGKPLIAWSIEAVKAAGNIDRVVVSTDDEEIADIAKSYGAEVPFLRPSDLATPSMTIGPALDYTIQRLKEKEGYEATALALLYPTQPLRKPETVRFLVDRLLEGYSNVLTYGPVRTGRLGLFTVDPESGALRPSSDGGTFTGGTRYHQSSGYFIGTSFQPNPLLPRMFHYPLESEHEALDIDYLEDLLLAEKVIEQCRV